jgi:hypothetical protein
MVTAPRRTAAHASSARPRPAEPPVLEPEVIMTDSNKPPPLRREVFIRRSPPPAEFKELGGSEVDAFNQDLADAALHTLWTAHSDEEQRERQDQAATAALMGAKPRDELEGMLVAQMLGCHHAAMECFRRAMLAGQGAEARQANLNSAAKMARAYAALLEALDRHRGKGQPQVVRVERVTVEAGGQAIVGAVGQGGGGGHDGSEERLHAKQRQQHQRRHGHAPEPALRGADAAREPVPVAGGGREAPLPDARRRQGQRRAAR